jgi:hypothetical protein
MNSQIANFPTAVAFGASVFLAQQIDCGVMAPNKNYFRLAGVENSNMAMVEGLRFSPVDFAVINEANLFFVESKAGISEQAELEKKFNQLAKKWKSETSGYYSVSSMTMHPAYLEIISHGDKMIPFILKDLQEKPNHWFIALKTLALTSPVKPEDAGNIKKMTEAWLAWGNANGKLS